MDVTRAFTDPRLELDGAWTDYRDGSRVKVARIGNPAFTRALAKSNRTTRAKKQDPEEEQRQLCKIMSETILLDWSGFTRAGEPLPYSSATAYELLMNHMDFRNDISNLAMEGEVFRAERMEEAAKN